jgi:hypothetical protein
MNIETPAATIYLWSPWRASMLEHKLFHELIALPQVQMEKEADEMRMTITDGKTWRRAVQIVERILKGWQEEAESGSERRTWFWLIDGDTDYNGFDHTGEKACLWAGIRLCLDRSNPSEMQKSEELDLENFGVQFLNEEEK